MGLARLVEKQAVRFPISIQMDLTFDIDYYAQRVIILQLTMLI